MKSLGLNLITISLIGLCLSACHSGWDKDPFSNKDGNIQNAVPQGGNKIKEPPIQEVMMLDVNPTYLLKEGGKRIITLNHRLLHPDFKFLGISIPNLDSELPGAVFDPNTNELTIETDEDYVPDGAVVFSSIVRVSLFAEYQGLKQEVRREIVFHVLKGSAQPPRIMEVTGLDPEYQEGTRKTFMVKVFDEASPTGPRLNISYDSQLKSNGAKFMIYPKKGSAVLGEPGVYTYEVNLNLDEEITIDSSSFSFEVQAISAFGEPSRVEKRSFKVFSQAAEPFHHGENSYQWQAGAPVNNQFIVAIPQRSGRLSTNFTTNCSETFGGDIRCSCRRINRLTYGCQMIGTPMKEGSHKLMFEAMTEIHKGKTFEDIKKLNKTINISVAPAPMTEPEPEEPMNEEL